MPDPVSVGQPEHGARAAFDGGGFHPLGRVGVELVHHLRGGSGEVDVNDRCSRGHFLNIYTRRLLFFFQ